MNKFIDWLRGYQEIKSSYPIELILADLDDAIEELTKAVKDVREDVDYLIEFLGIDD